jgi:hypothetical protein
MMIENRTNPVAIKEINETLANFAIPSQRESGSDKQSAL